MCGISAIVGHKNISPLMLKSIKNLEYRGYDSCGMAIINDNVLSVRKNIGGVDEVAEEENFLEMKGVIGISHTRWATHGKVTKDNAHPHLSNDKQFAIVHNGIIANYQMLRSELEKKGYQFFSETDTEIIANLLQDNYSPEKTIEEVFLNTISTIEGAYALAMITSYAPDTIFAVKNESPLVLGMDDGTNYIGSDLNAFISETKDAIILDDMEYAIVTKSSVTVKNVTTRKKVNKKVITIDWDQETAQKGGFSHYMLKEIFDQPQTISNALLMDKKTMEPIIDNFLNCEKSFLVGVGTTYFVSMVGTYFFSRFSGLYIPAISADEFSSLIPVTNKDHVLVVSQSGETYDSKMALKFAKQQGAATSAIVNVVGSSISMMVDHIMFQGCGPEICVVSTKAALSQMIMLYILSIKVGCQNGFLPQDQADKYLTELEEFPQILSKVLNEESGFIRQLASQTYKVQNWLFMGRGIYYPIAMESALKMKEVTYIHAEGLPAGFLKHGTLAMIDEELYSLFFLPSQANHELYKSTLTAVEEVKARGGKVVGFCMLSDQEAENLFDYKFTLPDISDNLMPFLELVMAQVFAYYTALLLNRSIDKPRNLAKSVTVG